VVLPVEFLDADGEVLVFLLQTLELLKGGLMSALQVCKLLCSLLVLHLLGQQGIVGFHQIVF